MTSFCNRTQEKIASGVSLEILDQKHLSECRHCQNIYADYQMLSTLIESNQNEFSVPDDFSDRVMKSILAEQSKSDWFDSIFNKIYHFLDAPVVQYSSMVTGFGLGLFSFIRFVAFIFIPA
jgi:hypothetical protein